MRHALRLFITSFSMILLLPLSAADAYKIDPVHSEVGFKIWHILSKTPGRFTKFQGTIQLDEKNLSKSSVEVTIDVTSINTDNEGRDKHLRSADFFDVEKFLTITFKSVGVKDKGSRQVDITGDFTMHGITKRITIPATFIGSGPGMRPGTTVAGFEASLKLNRSDYGIKTYPGVLGEEVEISINIEAGKVEPKAESNK